MELRKSGAKTIFFFLLVILGILGNSWHVSLPFGVVFLFGGIASFIVLIALGPRLAILATLLIAGETALFWHHFYLVWVLVGEIAFVGLLLKKPRHNLTLATGFYWLTLGIPAILVFFYFNLKMSFDGAFLIAVKQAINEIFNAVIASLILEHTPLSKLSFLRTKGPRPIFQTVFNLFVAVAIIPSFLILVLDAVFHRYVLTMSVLLVLILLILLVSQRLTALIGDPLTRLEQASRMKDEFLATLSHELRTPLNVILGHASLLKQEAAETKDGRIPSFETSIEAITRNASVQNQLVSDLLDISAIITGKISFQPKIVSLTEMARSVVESVRLSAEARGVRLSLQLTECPCTVLGDPTRLHQVIWNLLSNAIKFTPRDGQVTLKVLSEPVDGEKLSVIEVIDTGKGIDPEFLPHLFERFRQEDSTTTRQYGGLGLGLSIVRHIVELHGGTAQAFSEGKNRGARFRITFPFANARAENEPSTVTNHETRDDLKGLHLLVVDDDRDSCDLMSFVLQKAGAEVDTANSTREALEKCAQTEFDVVISDIGLPDEDGYAFIRKLRNDSQAASHERPAIALTAYARDEDRQKSLSSGFQSYLSKPVDVKKLIRMIRELAP